MRIQYILFLTLGALMALVLLCRVLKPTAILLGDKIDIPKRSIAREMGYLIGQKGIDKAIDRILSN